MDFWALSFHQWHFQLILCVIFGSRPRGMAKRGRPGPWGPKERPGPLPGSWPGAPSGHKLPAHLCILSRIPQHSLLSLFDMLAVQFSQQINQNPEVQQQQTKLFEQVLTSFLPVSQTRAQLDQECPTTDSQNVLHGPGFIASNRLFVLPGGQKLAQRQLGHSISILAIDWGAPEWARVGSVRVCGG